MRSASTSHPLYRKGAMLDQVKVSKGSMRHVQAVTSEPVSVLTKKGVKLSNLKKNVKLKKNVQAPVQKGDEIGTLTVSQDGKVLAKTTLVADKTVKRAGWWQLFKRAAGMFVQKD